MFRVSFLIILLLIACRYGTQSQTAPSTSQQRENSAPVVRIMTPVNNSIHPPNSMIRYAITVSDAEDGESKFDEILSDRILLEIKFVKERSDRPAEKGEVVPAIPVGLSLIINSDCMSCHQFRDRLIGPSFGQIAKHYARDSGAGNKLAARIRDGSKGIWGETLMPAHPDIGDEASRKMARWILKAGVDTKLNYIAGKEGTFRLEIPEGESEGFFLLTAIYTDKGLPENPADVRTGQDVVIIRTERRLLKYGPR